MNLLALHIEGLIFAAPSSIGYEEIKSVLTQALDAVMTDQQIQEALQIVIDKYKGEDFAIEIVEVADGFKFMTKGAYHNTIGIYLKQNTHRRLSKSALETLSIVAYKQPVPKSEIEAIRGVNSDYAIQKLLEKELVEIVGRSDGPGKPLLYGTSHKFMDYFGLKSMGDMPHLKDIEQIENQIGLITE